MKNIIFLYLTGYYLPKETKLVKVKTVNSQADILQSNHNQLNSHCLYSTS